MGQPFSFSCWRTMCSQLPLGTLMWTCSRGTISRTIAARLAGTVWYLSGKEIPSGRGQENQVALGLLESVDDERAGVGVALDDILIASAGVVDVVVFFPHGGLGHADVRGQIGAGFEHLEGRIPQLVLLVDIVHGLNHRRQNG